LRDLKRRDQFGDLIVDGRIILKLVSSEQLVTRIGFVQPRGSCEPTKGISGSITCGELLDQLSDYQLLNKEYYRCS
jgi:hypothetical protein